MGFVLLVQKYRTGSVKLSVEQVVKYGFNVNFISCGFDFGYAFVI